MVTYVFRPQAAIDQNGTLVVAGSGQVFDPTDAGYTTPLVVQNSAGVNITNISVSTIGQTERFSIVDRPHLVWKSGQYIVDIYSLDGMVSAVDAALAAVQAAQAVAEEAAEAVAEAPIALPPGGLTGYVLTKQSPADRDAVWAAPSGGGSGGVTVHGALSGLNADDHPQYLTEARGDGRYHLKSAVESLATAAGDAAYAAARQRGNHTGTQAISTVTNLETRLSALEAGSGATVTVDNISGATTLGRTMMKLANAGAGLTALGAASASDLAAKADATPTTNALNARLPIADDSPIKPVDEWFCTQAQFDAVTSPPATRFYTILEAV